MTLQDRKELEDRQAERVDDQEDTLWSGQSLEHDVGAETIYIHEEKVREVGLQEAVEQGHIRGLPVKTRVRNRMSSPVKIQSQYDDRRQLLQMEVIQTRDPILSAGGAVKAWTRHIIRLMNSRQRTLRLRAYLTILALLTIGVGLTWLIYSMSQALAGI